MSKEELMKIQTCVLKVNIHCDGCKNKVKKILQKIEGVFKTTVDSEQGKVTVLGNVNPDVLIKKLAKSGKHAELWGSSKATNNNNNNQGHLANQFKNMQMLDNGGKGGNNNNKNNNVGNNNKKEAPKGGNNNQPPKVGQPTPQQLQQHLQQLQQMKGFQDLKLPQLKDMKNSPIPNNNQKGLKFAEEDALSDDDDYDDDDELDDPRHPLNKMKPVMGNAPKGLPNNMMMLKGMMNVNHPQLMNAQKPAQNAGPNGKKGGAGGNGVPAGGGNNGNGGKKGGPVGGYNNGGNPNQGGGGGRNGGKNGPQEANKNVGGGVNNGGPNGGKKGNNGVSDGFPTMGGGPNGGNMGGPQRAAAMNMAMGQMGNIPAVQGLPATAAMNGNGGGGNGGYFQGAGPDVMPGNPYHQQQIMAAMMNQQRAVGGPSERFQPMMHARPPPAVNYMPPPYPYPYQYPYPHPYPHPQPDPYTHFFSDENTSSCNVM
ncbi:heavy metal-associated isoprenylated plant protein 33-like isoform X2 [Hibiscus syriacus]|uniref:heavy metal-associated isoprenylated plant protein 33-like isoform X2 n=1 Tax=Hibiscus syriacus TaxID=106335 RepID=UPI001923DC14|nr:heavy metal-associated isoprenylated plant protein 33-like isoform X2 [Hibiscus syriacus]